jgi:hypothetical protein
MYILDIAAVGVCGILPSLSVVYTKQGNQNFLQFACLLTIAVSQSIFRGQIRRCTNILCLFVAFYCVSNRYAFLRNTGLSNTPPAGHMWLAELYNIVHSFFAICEVQSPLFLKTAANIPVECCKYCSLSNVRA